MKPATRPPDRRDGARLLTIDRRTGALEDRNLTDLPDLLRSGDLLVVNDAATLPASLGGSLDEESIELRLLAHIDDATWRAVLFGAGDWRIPTEHRPPPPIALPGDRIALGPELVAIVVEVSPHSPRLLTVELQADDGDPLARVYEHGRPVQYSYLTDELPLWSVQTVYSARPWAVEMPSAGLPLSLSVLLEARRRGIGVARITHAAGLSSTGDPTIDRLLPLPERYDVPAETVAEIETARAAGGRIIAVGTTVVRALESAAMATGVAPGPGTTDLVIDDRHALAVVDGLLTGMHDPSESHFQLLSAFADRSVLLSAWAHAVSCGYSCHEFGDVSLVLTS